MTLLGYISQLTAALIGCWIKAFHPDGVWSCGAWSCGVWSCGKLVVVQVLSTRARKDVKVADIKVQVCLYAFDCLYLNGQVLVDRPLTERREALYSAIQEKPGELFYATAKVPQKLPCPHNLLLCLADVVGPVLVLCCLQR